MYNLAVTTTHPTDPKRPLYPGGKQSTPYTYLKILVSIFFFFFSYCDKCGFFTDLFRLFINIHIH